MMIKAFNAMRTSTHAKLLATTALGASLMLSSVAAQAELSANASITNNYLWRGLTQVMTAPHITTINSAPEESLISLIGKA